jgi:hypothetical protein
MISLKCAFLILSINFSTASSSGPNGLKVKSTKKDEIFSLEYMCFSIDFMLYGLLT